uniref:Uncharacterized protein n=1 Tax=Rhizophora mucronata TaxID=61149 RepID=A0A2P2PX86_RHIMU
MGEKKINLLRLPKKEKSNQGSAHSMPSNLTLTNHCPNESTPTTLPDSPESTLPPNIESIPIHPQRNEPPKNLGPRQPRLR